MSGQSKPEIVESMRKMGGMMGCSVIVVSRLPLFLLMFGASLLPDGSVLGANLDPAPIADLRQIKKFVSVEVQTQGTAEKIGINSADLTDMTRVTLLNKLPGIALEGSSGPSLDTTERLSQLGFFTCEVWTVGEQYIAAYHVDCNAGSYTIQKTPGSLWNQAILGYGPKDDVADAVRKGVRAMVELFATIFLNARGEGGVR
ncbi:MAG: exported protein of unknown function [Nitrospira sp.]|jgi:hypothetical protein|nr:exported protein of unknown function [Nitrospira sp.]